MPIHPGASAQNIMHPIPPAPRPVKEVPDYKFRIHTRPRLLSDASLLAASSCKSWCDTCKRKWRDFKWWCHLQKFWILSRYDHDRMWVKEQWRRWKSNGDDAERCVWRPSLCSLKISEARGPLADGCPQLSFPGHRPRNRGTVQTVLDVNTNLGGLGSCREWQTWLPSYTTGSR